MKTSKILALFVAVFQCVAATPRWHTASDGNEYLIEDDKKYNWLQAYDECARLDLQLVVIDNAAKNNALDALLRKVFEKAVDLWLGHHDEFNAEIDTKRSFYSIATGAKLTFANWNAATGEPNNVNGNEHCVQIRHRMDFNWNDFSCENGRFGYICEQGHRINKDDDRDLDDIRRSVYAMNTQLAADYTKNSVEMKQILEDTRNSTAKLLAEFQQSTDEVIAKSKDSFDALVRQKPYLQAIIADVGDDIRAILLEAIEELSTLPDGLQESIENVHTSAEASINDMSTDFANKLEYNKNAVDKLFEKNK